MEPVNPAAAPCMLRRVVCQLVSEHGAQLLGRQHVQQRQPQLQNRPRPAEQSQPGNVPDARVEIHRDPNVVERPTLQLALRELSIAPSRRLAGFQPAPLRRCVIDGQEDDGLRDREHDHQDAANQEPDADLELQNDSQGERGAPRKNKNTR